MREPWVRAEERKRRGSGVAAWTINLAVHSLFAERAQAERERRTRVREEIAQAIQTRRGQAGGAG